MKNNMETHPRRPMLFICHTSLDEAYVTDLAAKLEARGIRCWYYERDNNGESIGLAVDKALDESLCLLFVMSENIPETSQYIQNELIEFVRTKRKVIPLRVFMPQSFWPKGSKSLIGAFPVVDDGNGRAEDSAVSEIVRRVANEAQTPNPLSDNSEGSHGNKSSSRDGDASLPASRFKHGIGRHLIYGLLNLFVFAAIVSLTIFSMRLVHGRNDVPPEEELENLVTLKISEMPWSVKNEWDASLVRIEESEKTIAKLEEETKEEEEKFHFERLEIEKELKELEEAETAPIRRSTPKYQ